MSDFILPLHILSLLFVVWNVINADHIGFTWIRGTESILDPKVVQKYHRGTWIGLGLMIFTGSFLFWPMREFLLTRPQFYIKMGFVLALIINGLAIGNLQKRATTQRFRNLTQQERIPLFISGGISTISWLGAAAMAFFLLPD